jgi:hypothetical protein
MPHIRRGIHYNQVVPDFDPRDYLPDDWIHDDPIALETLIKLAEDYKFDLGFTEEDKKQFKQVSQTIAIRLWVVAHIVDAYEELLEKCFQLEDDKLGLEARLYRRFGTPTERPGINPNSDEGAIALAILEKWGDDGPPATLKGKAFQRQVIAVLKEKKDWKDLSNEAINSRLQSHTFLRGRKLATEERERRKAERKK